MAMPNTWYVQSTCKPARPHECMFGSSVRCYARSTDCLNDKQRQLLLQRGQGQVKTLDEVLVTFSMLCVE